MDKIPAVDFVVLSLNRVDSTIETIDNILNQKGIAPVIYIVDQASYLEHITKLEKYLKNYNNVNLIKLQENVGVAKGRDLGIKSGNNDFIIELDNDAIFFNETDSLTSIYLFRSDPSLGAIGFQIDNYYTKLIDPQFWVYPKRLFIDSNPNPFFATRFPGGGHALRRKAYEETKGFDPILFFYWEELDLSYQMINKGYKIRFSPEVKVLHKSEPNQRINWKEKRYYYLVRNSLYLNYKYFGFHSNLVFLTIGYFFRAVRNSVLAQYFRGVQDSIKMINQMMDKKSFLMNGAGKKYILENDLKYRGNFVNRFFNETFVKLN